VRVIVEIQEIVYWSVMSMELMENINYKIIEYKLFYIFKFSSFYLNM